MWAMMPILRYRSSGVVRAINQVSGPESDVSEDEVGAGTRFRIQRLQARSDAFKCDFYQQKRGWTWRFRRSRYPSAIAGCTRHCSASGDPKARPLFWPGEAN